MADFVLERGKGLYRLVPMTDGARVHLTSNYGDDAISPRDGALLLPAFFGDAATGASHIVREGFSLQWGAAFYPAGEAGADTLYDEVG